MDERSESDGLESAFLRWWESPLGYDDAYFMGRTSEEWAENERAARIAFKAGWDARRFDQNEHWFRKWEQEHFLVHRLNAEHSKALRELTAHYRDQLARSEAGAGTEGEG